MKEFDPSKIIQVWSSGVRCGVALAPLWTSPNPGFFLVRTAQSYTGCGGHNRKREKIGLYKYFRLLYIFSSTCGCRWVSIEWWCNVVSGRRNSCQVRALIIKEHRKLLINIQEYLLLAHFLDDFHGICETTLHLFLF